MKRKIKRPDQEGFTIIELMISLAILAVGMLGIMSMQISSMQGNSDTVKYTEANLAAQSQFEFFIMADYDSITNDAASTADGYTVVTSAQLNTIPQDFTLEYRMSETDLDADGTNDIKEIRIKVRDNDQKVRSDITFVKPRG